MCENKRRKKRRVDLSSRNATAIYRCFLCVFVCIGLQGLLCSASPSSLSNVEDLEIESDENQIVALYSTINETINFTHVAIDESTGKIYIGATNWLLQFNSSLDLEVRRCSSQSTYKLTNMANINKALVIDRYKRNLLVCGSAHQGACRTHQLSNITKFSKLTPFPVTANDENSSTYAFIGPASYATRDNRVLYVGATNSRLGSYRYFVPAICSRSLSDGSEWLRSIEGSNLGTATVEINRLSRDYFIVSYKYGFYSNGFTYFATVQRKSHLRQLEEEGYISRLARVCANDDEYKTYTEVTLQCLGADGTYYNLLQDASVVKAGSALATDLNIPTEGDVFVGVFAKSRDHTDRPDNLSAICVFSVADIEQKFTENIHTCYNGTARTRNMAYIAGSVNQCPEPGKGGNIFDFCSETLKLNGSIPLVTVAAREYQNTTLTSVMTTVTSSHTVAFVGTHLGHLKKILLNRSTEAIEFEEVLVDSGNRVLPDLHIDNTKQFVYVTTPYKISKVRIENCRAHTSCDTCLGAKNPYCGWCSLEKRCTVKAACRNATKFTLDRSPSRWLSLGARHCIDFQLVRPEHLPITAMADVELTILKLPQLPYGARYLCVFGESAPILAKPSRSGLFCLTPVLPARPRIAPEKDHVYVDLAVRSSETRTDFVHRPFAFYDCSVHTTCKSCVTSNWPCTWCMYENKCTHNASSCKMRKIFGENNPVESFVKGKSFCPAFNIKEQILVPNGIRKEIVIDVTHMPTPQEGFQCLIEIEGAKELVSAKVRGSKVICAETMYSYLAKVKEINARLTITWNQNHYIDTTNITLYKCNILGSFSNRPDCSLCTTLDRKYHCSWCKDSCNFDELCTDSKAFGICPRPRIDTIRPSNGPIEGGTLVTIEGSNLGTDFNEIKDHTFIGNIPCDPIEYNVSVRIVCRTRRSPNGPYAASVKVGNKAGETKSDIMFHYKAVTLNDVSPNRGPQSGGTILYISGSNLNIGSRVEVNMDGSPCRVNTLLTGSSQITCVTHRGPRPSYIVQNMTLHIDSAVRVLTKPFIYIADPTILKIQPLASYFSGGRSLTVLGTNLTSVQQPRFAIFQGKKFISETVCKVYSSSDMMCPSPTVELSKLFRYKRDIPRSRYRSNRFRIGFIMDDVETVKDLKRYFPLVKSDLFYVPDPIFYPFENDQIKLYKGESLVIEGENLTLASEDREVNVTIGTRPCNVTSLAMNQLVCLPPEVQPPGTDEIGRRTDHKLPLVVVRVGQNLRFPIGYLRYEVSKQYEFPPEAVAGIAAGGATLILLSIIIMMIYRRKSTQAEREYKRIQIQMDTLESNVRSECKQEVYFMAFKFPVILITHLYYTFTAFAELQTDMTDLTTDIQATGIPTLEQQFFVIKVFFPGVPEHYFLNNPNIPEVPYRTSYDTAMQQFEQLLNNKYFLLTFIETLENQKSFSIRDNILRSLLLRLIDKSVGNKHPQLMLRRTESVVEKLLTNWMALCIINLEKGPVDSYTFDARYSLSEDRLLREQINHTWVTVQVVQDDIDEKITCRVLDCDSISQVKMKILDALYKNTPHSLRPTIKDIDLELRHGRGSHVILADEDITTKTVNGWRQVNTLRHYGVRDLAIMGLIPRQIASYGSNCKSRLGSGLSTIRSSNSLIYPMEVEKGVKWWHLVKPVDDHMLHIKDVNHKTVPEIFLTRLLSTKGTIQKFVDDFFVSVMTVNENLPPAVKWLFDLLDEAAHKHGIVDPEVIHAWKSNSLPLRFWVNFIKNPDFIFDINKTATVDSCLSVIAQTFMDSCSMNEHRLGKDSPSNKLLFAKDIPRYKQLVTKFYRDIESLPSIPDQEMCASMQHLSQDVHYHNFKVNHALKDLYIYAEKYHSMILEALDTNPYAEKFHLRHLLENVACTLEGEETSTC
ncbi:Plexin-B [Nymphon striatum]|nr:Plexin-B [Nymphon striatum]